MRERFLFLVLSFLFCVSSYGQSISGVVVDEEGKPLIGVALSLMHSNTTFDVLYSDLDGKIVINDVIQAIIKLNLILIT